MKKYLSLFLCIFLFINCFVYAIEPSVGTNTLTFEPSIGANTINIENNFSGVFAIIQWVLYFISLCLIIFCIIKLIRDLRTPSKSKLKSILFFIILLVVAFILAYLSFQIVNLI